MLTGWVDEPNLSSFADTFKIQYWQCCSGQESLITYRPDKLKQLHNGRVQQVVFMAIILESLYDWFKELPFGDITIVKLILHSHYPSKKSQSTLRKTQKSRVNTTN